MRRRSATLRGGRFGWRRHSPVAGSGARPPAGHSRAQREGAGWGLLLEPLDEPEVQHARVLLQRLCEDHGQARGRWLRGGHHVSGAPEPEPGLVHRKRPELRGEQRVPAHGPHCLTLPRRRQIPVRAAAPVLRGRGFRVDLGRQRLGGPEGRCGGRGRAPRHTRGHVARVPDVFRGLRQWPRAPSRSARAEHDGQVHPPRLGNRRSAVQGDLAGISPVGNR
mmetsp:Transcript_84640/g.221038  ORF Transcript_84640/g.221038 Transcript_84640/m.221038 type:complete len:221 (-) Transcript_84640:480-1142(-)